VFAGARPACHSEADLLSFGLRTYRRLGVSLFGSSLLVLAGVVLAGACSVAPRATPASPWDGSSVAASDGSGSSGAFGETDADACQPGSVATYRPDAYHPASGPAQGACAADDAGDPISEFYDQCLGPSRSSDLCNQFRQANAACVACILTPETAARYGPILDQGGFVTANVAGCLELAGDQQQQPDASELPCAKAVQALAGCELDACDANCPVDDPTSLTEYDQCAASAAAAGCQSYETAAACADAEGEASAFGAACLSDFQNFYNVVVPLFCGPSAPGDSGAAALDAAGEASLSDATSE
jgi:hypothetical protein